MANQTTMIADLIDPEVMADMISGKIEKKMVTSPFCKVDNTLQGRPGTTITVPQYGYIGDAEDVAEGAACETAKLSTSSVQYSVKKAMKAVEITDEAILSGYGNPVGEATSQIAKAIASKADSDNIDVLQEATTNFDGSSAKIAYSGIVDALDLFGEELNSEKVMFVHPSQVTTLRKDADFLSADKYPGQVMVTGEIGKISNVRIVPSKKVPALTEWYKADSSGTVTVSDSNLEEIKATCPAAQVGDKVTKMTTAVYSNPIIKLESDTETEDETAALTLYLKRDTNVETDRVTLSRKTNISADKHYVSALTNQAKVVLARFKK
ncbi:MAG: N4-gp56 family major capsid protein [Lachnospira sp.]